MMKIGLGTKIAAVLGLALAGTGFFAKMQTDRIDRLKIELANAQNAALTWKADVDKAEGRRTAETAQCNASVAGLMERHKTELAKATAAATARASLVRACPSRPLTPSERVKALRVNSGESK
jgi:hypothetical protein